MEHFRNLKRAEKRDGRCDVLACGNDMADIYEPKMIVVMKMRSNHANMPISVGENS